MMWCVFFNGSKRVSEIMQCDESLIEKGSSMTVYTSQYRKTLESIIEKMQNIGVRQEKKLLDDALVKVLKQYEKEGEWRKIHDTVLEVTGQRLCCGTLEPFMKSL